MSVSEIKKTKSNLIAWIEGLSDVNILTALDSLRNSNEDIDWWDACLMRKNNISMKA